MRSFGPCMCGDTECPSCGAAQGTLTRLDAILHDMDADGKPQRFQYLSQALHQAWQTKATGYIVTPKSEVIVVRNGKRRASIIEGKGKWVPCSRESSTLLPRLDLSHSTPAISNPYFW